jgi:hypothetical protein
MQIAPMFLLINIHDRKYKPLYPGIRDVIFDIPENQLNNIKNHDWQQIKSGGVVGGVNSTRKISTFYVVAGRYL